MTDDTSTSPASDSTAPAQAGSGDSGDSPAAGYSRGENQKPVTDRYRRNWDAIFGGNKRRGRRGRER